MRRYFLALLILVVVICGAVAWHNHESKSTANTVANSVTPPTASTKKSATKSNFDKHKYSLSDPNSIWIVVNKQRPLNPVNYAPSDLVVPKVPLRVPGNDSMQLRAVAATALETMFSDAKKQGLNLMLSSGYRSYTYQVSLYGSYVQSQGKAAADTFSARPGYSEHQTGLAADVEPVNGMCDVAQCFGQLPEGKWVAANAYKYGFIVRYTADNHSFAGYEPEPWHVRYIGIAAATEMRSENTPSLEQFFDLPAAPNY